MSAKKTLRKNSSTSSRISVSSSRVSSSSRSSKKKAAEKEKTNVELDDELDDDLNNFGNVFESGKKSKSSLVEEASKERRGKNKIFAHIQKEIETKEHNKPKINDNDMVCFVDKQRNAAVVIGNRDLKADVASKRRRERLQGQEDAADEQDYMTYVTQGLFELRSGSAEIALTYFDSAISLQPDDELPFIYRAQCKIKLDLPRDAILDAEEALRYNKTSTKATTCKGEALYNMGEFEQALVQFERGYRVRQDAALRAGMVKCRDVIKRTVGDAGRQYCVTVVEKAIKEMARVKEQEAKAAVEKTKMASKHTEKKKQKADKTPEMKKTDRQLLGKFNKDVLFLEKFITTQTTKNSNEDAQKMAVDALKYLEGRKNFWQQTA